MDPSQDRFDEAGPPRSGEGEIESSEASFDRIKVRGAGQLRQAAGTLRGKAEGNQTPREAGNFGAHELRRLHRVDGAKKIKDDITEQARRNPGKSLLVAAAAWGSQL